MKTSIVKIPLYFETLQIVVTKNLKKALRKLKIKANASDYEAFVIPKKDKIILLLDPNASSGIIAHEAVHIVNIIFKRTGIDLDVNNDEPQAYLMGWIVEEITKKLKQYV